jgi:membrane-associated phospholipid phosphatase
MSTAVQRDGRARGVATRLAWAVSTVLHPFVVHRPLSGWRRGRVARAGVVGGARRAGKIVPVAILMVVQVRRGGGRTPTRRMSRRPLLYAVALAGLSAVVGWLIVRDPASFFLRGASMVLAMLVVAALATRWVKVSLHVAFVALAATVLTLSGSTAGYALIPAVPAVAWSRLVLARHSVAELMCGAALGLVAGALGVA